MMIDLQQFPVQSCDFTLLGGALAPQQIAHIEGEQVRDECFMMFRQLLILLLAGPLASLYELVDVLLTVVGELAI